MVSCCLTAPLRRTLRFSCIAALVASVGCGGDGASNASGDDAASGDSGIADADARDDGASHDADAASDSKTIADTSPSEDGGIPGATGCSPLVVSPGVVVDGSKSDTFAWTDAACRPRSASLVRNDATDAFGEHGGYLRAIADEGAG